MTSVLDRTLRVPPQVSVRAEPFGALLYHFGTRRLSFLKDRRLLSVVQNLDGAATARAACEEAGVDAAVMPAFERAIARLVDGGMLREHES